MKQISENSHYLCVVVQVLLVLDGVDALIEQGAGEARDNLVDLLSQLCRFGRGKLTLLLTSEETLLEGTNRRFQNGSEKVTMFKKSIFLYDHARLHIPLIPLQLLLNPLRTHPWETTLSC